MRRPSEITSLVPGLVLFGLGALTGVLVTGTFTRIRELDQNPDVALYRVVRDRVEHSFVRHVDREVLVDDALAGMVEGLDRYSHYYGRDELEDHDRETQGTYTGLGVIFRTPVEQGQVLFTLAGSPAERAGLRVGDRVLAVDGEPVERLGAQGFRESLRRGPGHELVLRVSDLAGDERSVKVLPAPVTDPSVRHARIEDPARGIAYLALTSFTRRTPGEFDAAVEWLRGQGMRALVLDVRGNPGGVLTSAVHVADRFIEEGPIVSTRSRDGEHVERASAGRTTLAGLPLVVLMDGSSASASEVLAGALQDHRAAVLAGEPSYGKGAVQSLTRFGGKPGRAVLKVTTGYYTTPAGRLIERELYPDDPSGAHSGLEPDLWAPLDEATRRSVHEFLRSYGPPPAARAALMAWEARAGEELFDRPPRDAQLEAALTLLAGSRPGPHALGATGSRDG